MKESGDTKILAQTLKISEAFARQKRRTMSKQATSQW